MTPMTFYEVGGCVRDSFMGRQSKDIDYTVEAASFDAMRDGLNERGYKIFVESPQFLTIRARQPGTNMTFDFVLARADGEYVDGRRPETVVAGTLMDDLARRDFTMNAIARDEDGNIIDPFNGQQDIKDRIIRAVGSPYERFTEDGLRIARAIRFAIVFGFTIESRTHDAMCHPKALDALRGVAIERVQVEMEKAFSTDTLGAIRFFADRVPPVVADAIFRDGLRLSATLKA